MEKTEQTQLQMDPDKPRLEMNERVGIVEAILFVTGNAVEGVMDVQLALFGADEQPLWQQEIPAVDFSASFGQKLLGEFSLAGVLTQPGDYMMAAYIGGKLGTTTLLTVSP